MTKKSYLKAVVEAPTVDLPTLPWEISKREPFQLIQLDGNKTQQDVGLVVLQLALFNTEATAQNSSEFIRDILAVESLALPGGVQALNSFGRSIAPSCCCGLEEWPAWKNVLETGDSPWLGHDPTPWIEIKADQIRVWSNGGNGKSAHKLNTKTNHNQKPYYVDFTRNSYQHAITQLQRDLKDFLKRLEQWINKIEPAATTKFLNKFAASFHIE